MNTIQERFLKKVKKIKSCWVWQGCIVKNYGQMWDGEKVDGAHRISYRLFKGEISKGLQIDHLCQNPKCVNPKHLEMVTPKENIKRGKNGNKTHCHAGHKFTVENVIKRKNGTRTCRQCKNLRKKRYRREGRI